MVLSLGQRQSGNTACGLFETCSTYVSGFATHVPTLLGQEMLDSWLTVIDCGTAGRQPKFRTNVKQAFSFARRRPLAAICMRGGAATLEMLPCRAHTQDRSVAHGRMTNKWA